MFTSSVLFVLHKQYKYLSIDNYNKRFTNKLGRIKTPLWNAVRKTFHTKIVNVKIKRTSSKTCISVVQPFL